MSEENEKNLPEELVAFKLIQHFAMQGEAPYEDFQRRIQALKLIALKLDQLRQLEARVAEQERYIEQLESDLSNHEIASEISPEVIQDLEAASE